MANNMEQMKKIIEEKKKKQSQQGTADGTSSKANTAVNKGFTGNKRAGSLNK